MFQMSDNLNHSFA